MYSYGIEQIDGIKIENNVLIAIEKSNYPFECAVYELDNKVMKHGLKEYHNFMDILKKALDTGEWKPYQRTIGMITLPKWLNN
jgi:hypothetical protein